MIRVLLIAALACIAVGSLAGCKAEIETDDRATIAVPQ
jgi:hypothetical protein